MAEKRVRLDDLCDKTYKSSDENSNQMVARKQSMPIIIIY